MTKIEEVCTSLAQEFSGDKTYVFEKKASVAPKKVTIKLPEHIGLKKIASEIRQALKPVEVSYNDINNFIKDIQS